MNKILSKLPAEIKKELAHSVLAHQCKDTFDRMKSLLDIAQKWQNGSNGIDPNFSKITGICVNTDIYGSILNKVYIRYFNEPMNKFWFINLSGTCLRYRGDPEYPVGFGHWQYLHNREKYIGKYGLKRIEYLKWLIQVFEEVYEEYLIK